MMGFVEARAKKENSRAVARELLRMRSSLPIAMMAATVMVTATMLAATVIAAAVMETTTIVTTVMVAATMAIAAFAAAAMRPSSGNRLELAGGELKRHNVNVRRKCHPFYS
jgi:hypothetical protein